MACVTNLWRILMQEQSNLNYKTYAMQMTDTSLQN